MARYLLTMSEDLAVTYGFAITLLAAFGLLTLLLLQLRYYFMHGRYPLSDLSLVARWVGEFRAPVAVELLGAKQATRLDPATFVTFSAVFATSLSLLKPPPVARGGARRCISWRELWNAGLLCGQSVLFLLWFPALAGPWTGAKTVAWLIEVSLGTLVMFAAVMLPTTNLRETTGRRCLRLQELLTQRKEKYEHFDAALRREIEARESDFRAVRARRRWAGAVWGTFIAGAAWAILHQGDWKIVPGVRLGVLVLASALIWSVLAYWVLFFQATSAGQDRKVAGGEKLLLLVPGGITAAMVLSTTLVIALRDFHCWGWLWGPLAAVFAIWGGKYLLGKMCGHACPWRDRHRLVQYLTARRLLQQQDMLREALAELPGTSAVGLVPARVRRQRPVSRVSARRAGQLRQSMRAERYSSQ